MRGMLILLVLLIAGGAIYSYIQANPLPGEEPSTQAEPAGTPVNFNQTISGAHSTIETRQNYLITSHEELALLWQMTDAGGALPGVDFLKQDVIVSFLGKKPTAGYTLAVTTVRDTDTARTVYVTITQPGGSCVVPPNATAPYEIIVLPKTALVYKHVDKVVTTSCFQ